MEKIRPFVKWAGGKGSLIEQLTKYYPLDIMEWTIDTYIEPFVGGGSKLNETAKSYKLLYEESKNTINFKFAWFTDGLGWKSTKRNLKETFDVMNDIYNLNDIKNGAMKKLFI